MKAPFRFRRLAQAASHFIGAMESYRRDANSSNVTPLQMAQDVSDFIVVGWEDANFNRDERRMLASHLIEELRVKFDLKK